MNVDTVFQWCAASIAVALVLFLWGALIALVYVTYKYMKEKA